MSDGQDGRRWSDAFQPEAFQSVVPEFGDLHPGLISVPVRPPGQLYHMPNAGPLTGEMIYAGHGDPPRHGEDRPNLSAWARLVRGAPLGQKTILVYNQADTSTQSKAPTILRIAGDDLDAQLIQVTLSPPLVVPLMYSPLLRNASNLTGEQNNIQNTGVFPGTGAPTVWPQLEAVIEWGVGGTSNRMVVDFINGAKIPNLSASWLQVSVQVRNDEQPGTSAAYVLSAFVGPGPGVSEAQYTSPFGTINAGDESAVAPIPLFARKAYVTSADPSATPTVGVATLRMWRDRAKTNCVANYVVTGNQPLPFPIPNAAKYASIINGTGVNIPFSLIYTLS